MFNKNQASNYLMFIVIGLILVLVSCLDYNDDEYYTADKSTNITEMKNYDLPPDQVYDEPISSSYKSKLKILTGLS